MLRLPTRPGWGDVTAAVATLARNLSVLSAEGKLWVVASGRVREYQPRDDDRE